MKKTLNLFAALILSLVLMSACSEKEPSDTNAEPPSDNATTEAAHEKETEEKTEKESEKVTGKESETEKESESEKKTETEPESETEEAVTVPREPISAELYYKDGYTNNTITAIDMFNRISPAAVGEKEDKERVVTMYYTPGQVTSSRPIFDAVEILKMENGVNIMFSRTLPEPEIAPPDEAYFSGKPLWGYYSTTDKWVLRRQVELFSEAGVDAIVLDVTNFVWYEEVYTALMAVISEIKADGHEAPGVVFYTHTGSIDLTRYLYNNVYKANLYPDAWFYLNGKPLIIAYRNGEEGDRKELGLSVEEYGVAPLSEEILNFFTFRTPQWPTEGPIRNGFPWIEWSYPAPIHDGLIAVNVAAHPHIPFSASLTSGVKNWGRGYDVKSKKNIAEDVNKGTFFQTNWNYALTRDPDIIAVNAWNEWTATKTLYRGEYVMADTCNVEYSRNIEMMKTDYEDAFYIQLMTNVREYKYNSANAFMIEHENKTIDIKGDISQWDGTKAVFRDVTLDNTKRSSRGATLKLKYTEDPARNNVVTVKAEADKDYIYLLLTATEDITAREAADEGWMNIFLTPGRIKAGGWEGYKFLVNRTGSDGKCSVESLDKNMNKTTVGEAEYYVSGKNMTVKIPKSALSMAEADYEFYFKVADNITEKNEIMDYYVSGKSLPLGRMSFQYLG